MGFSVVGFQFLVIPNSFVTSFSFSVQEGELYIIFLSAVHQEPGKAFLEAFTDGIKDYQKTFQRELPLRADTTQCIQHSTPEELLRLKGFTIPDLSLFSGPESNLPFFVSEIAFSQSLSEARKVLFKAFRTSDDHGIHEVEGGLLANYCEGKRKIPQKALPDLIVDG